MRLTVTILIGLILASAASAARTPTLRHREWRQERTLHRDQGTIRFFANHPMLMVKATTRIAAWHALRFAHQQIEWTRRELARTRAELTVTPWPPHHRLWMCIHDQEASNWQDPNSGGNGHYGGLQMHPGWGYGTSFYASDDSQLTQEWAAERGYQANGYSQTWLMHQWYHPNCLAYA